MSSSVTHAAGSKSLDTAWVRQQFPSLQTQVNGQPAAFLDGPAGTQVSQQVIDAIMNFLLHETPTPCGPSPTARHNAPMICGARQAMADFFNCAPDEVSF